MNINEAIVQGVIKQAGSLAATENFRNELTPVNGYLTSLGEELLKAYSGTTNNYGCFDEDENTYPFQRGLRSYHNREQGLVDLSQSCGRLIMSRMKSSMLSTGGYACFLRYTNQGTDWLLIAMLKLKAHITIDENSLQLNESRAFDISHLHEAARIDLARWQANDQPYLSFIKRRGQQDQVSQYFRLAIGCTDYTDSRANTNAAIRAINDYGEHKGWEPSRRQAARQAAYEYFQAKHNANEPVNRSALSAVINDQEPTDFSAFMDANNVPVSETFSPHRRTFDQLRRIKGTFGGVSVAFDVQDVIDSRVDYNSEDKQLIIKDPPQRLIDAIERAKGHDSTS